jgi:hypothetical protein
MGWVLKYVARGGVEGASWDETPAPFYDPVQGRFVKVRKRDSSRPGLYTTPSGIGVRWEGVELKDRKRG